MLSGENGIINKTNSAKSETGKAEEKESVQLATLTALTVGNGEIEKGSDAMTALQNELEKAGCINYASIVELPAIAEMPMGFYKIDEYGNVSEDVPSVEETDVTKLTTPVSENVIYKDESSVNTTNKTAVIPTGFQVSSKIEEQKIDSGLVVIAPDGSEFVWVPVDDINSMVMCQSHTGESDCNIVKGANGELKCENHDNTLICGKLYANIIENNFDSNLDTQEYSENDLREPAVLNDYDGDTSTEDGMGLDLLNSIVGIDKIEDWQTQLQDEFEEMARSVCENKGFYVGRYETSLKTLENGTKVAQSIANQNSATAESSSANTWYGLYQKEKEYSVKNSLINIVGSTMIWGSQYDQMMLWMEVNGIDVKSSESTKLNGAEKNTTYTTGITGDKDVLNNVYDLLGCKYEWTLEAFYTFGRVCRGGSSGNVSPSYRHTAMFPYETSFYESSRTTLYLK